MSIFILARMVASSLPPSSPSSFLRVFKVTAGVSIPSPVWEVPGVHNPVYSTCMKYSRVINFIELESRMVVARVLGRGNGSYFLVGTSQFGVMEKFLKMDGGKSCTMQ